jgi:thiol-disulfide isomerase/thioredoxin
MPCRDERQSLAPIYEQLGDAFAYAKDKVSIIKVDADGKGKAVGQKYGVSGFPSKHRHVDEKPSSLTRRRLQPSNGSMEMIQNQKHTMVHVN